MTFTKSWLGYDIAPDLIEAHPAVQTLRSQGIEKHGEREYHLVVATFESVELDALNELVARTETETGTALAEAVLAFDGYGIVESTPGTYAYFSPSSGGARSAGDLKGRVVAAPFYDVTKNCRDVHLTIGGVDPLSLEKPKRGPLKQPFEAKGRLAFVGFDGKNWQRYFWNSSSHVFVLEGAASAETPKQAVAAPAPVVETPKPVIKEEKPVAEPPKPVVEESLSAPEAKIPLPEAPKVVVETPKAVPESPKPIVEEAKPIVKPVQPAVEAPKPVVEEKKPEPKPVAAAPAPKPAAEPIAIKTLLLPTRVMPDVACTVYLLRAYGAKLYPGAAEAETVFASELPAGKTPDTLMSEGTYVVERRGECASTSLAARLGVSDRPELRKLLAYAKRDFEKKGTLSTDPLDRAFGLTGVSMMMNRVYAEEPRAVLDFLISVFEAYAYDESKRPA